MTKVKDLAMVIADRASSLCPLDSERYELTVRLEEYLSEVLLGKHPIEDLLEWTPFATMRIEVQEWWHYATDLIEEAIESYSVVFTQPFQHCSLAQLSRTRRLLQALDTWEALVMADTALVYKTGERTKLEIALLLAQAVAYILRSTCTPQQLSLDVGDSPCR